VFYNYPKVAVVVRDFLKGLVAIIAAKVAVNLGLTKVVKEPFVCLTD